MIKFISLSLALFISTTVTSQTPSFFIEDQKETEQVVSLPSPSIKELYLFTKNHRVFSKEDSLLKEYKDSLYSTIKVNYPVDSYLNKRFLYKGYIDSLCYIYNIDPFLIYALITKESGWSESASNMGCNGLCQVLQGSKDPFNNLRQGIFKYYTYSKIISSSPNNQLSDKDQVKVLMSYNMGPAGAKRFIKKGVQSKYALRIISLSKVYKKLDYLIKDKYNAETIKFIGLWRKNKF